MAALPEGLDPAMAERFEALRLAFLRGVPQRLQDAVAAGDDAARHQALHRLAGAAGSFGCEGLGQAAREALAALDAGDPAMLDAALGRLRAAAAAAQA